MLVQFNVQLAYIEGKKVAELADEDLKKPTSEDLYDTIINKEELSELIKIPSRMFKGPKGPEVAAVTIQKNWRRYKARSAYVQLQFLMGKATVIQRRFRLFQEMKQTKQKIEELNNESLFVWREMQEEFKRMWPEIKKKRRIEVHMNSFSMSDGKRIAMEKFAQRENNQISRIFALKDPNLEIVYVSPFPLTNDVLGYYLKVRRELMNLPDFPNRRNPKRDLSLPRDRA